MPEYPNAQEIREKLEPWPDLGDVQLGIRFVTAAVAVCDEAQREGGIFMDTQVIAKLQFIEKVLNG